MPTCDIHQAADLLKVHWQTVLDLIGTGILPAAKIVRALVMLEGDVINHLTREVAKQTAARLGQGGAPRPRQKRRRSALPELVGQV